jgi:hypothetical protein
MPNPNSKKGSHRSINTRSNESSLRTGKKRAPENTSLNVHTKKQRAPHSRNIHSNSSFDEEEQILIDRRYSSDYNEDDLDDNFDYNRKSTNKAHRYSNERSQEDRVEISDSRLKVDDCPIVKADVGLFETSDHSSDESLSKCNLMHRVTALEIRVEQIETKLKQNEATSFLTKGKRNSSKFFSLTNNQRSHIANAVRDNLFMNFKYFDINAIRKEGDNIINICIDAAKMTGEEADKDILCSAVTQQIRSSLGYKRGHISFAIRLEAKGMFSSDMLQCI